MTHSMNDTAAIHAQLAESEQTMQLGQHLTGSRQGDHIHGSPQDDYIDDPSGNNDLEGGPGGDFIVGSGRIEGGRDNDIIIATDTPGNTYVFNPGDGHDILYLEHADTSNGLGTLLLGGHLAIGQLHFVRHGDNLVIQMPHDDSVEVAGWFRGAQFQFDDLRTANGEFMAGGVISDNIQPPAINDPGLHPAAQAALLTQAMASYGTSFAALDAPHGLAQAPSCDPVLPLLATR